MERGIGWLLVMVMAVANKWFSCARVRAVRRLDIRAAEAVLLKATARVVGGV